MTEIDSDLVSPAAGHYLPRFLSAQVTIYYHPAGGGLTDTGRVTYIDDSWLELTKENKDILLIPVTAIRLVKVLDSARLHGESAVLLRAVEAPPDERRKQLGRE